MTKPRDSDLDALRFLIGSPWRNIEARGGRLTFQSTSYPLAWSPTSLIVNAERTVMIGGGSFDDGLDEKFYLEPIEGAEALKLRNHPHSRPKFSAISSWPPGFHVASGFWQGGARQIELGLASPLPIVATGESFLPIVWCQLACDDGMMFLYPDQDFLLNVGVTTAPESARAIQADIPVISTIVLT